MHSSGKFFSEEFLCLSKKLQIQLYFVNFLNIILISKNFEKNFKKSLHFPRGYANINESPGQRVLSRQPGVAKFGIALEWGSRGPEFESRHSDQLRLLKKMQPLKPLLRQGFQPFQREKSSTSRDGDTKGHFRDVG